MALPPYTGSASTSALFIVKFSERESLGLGPQGSEHQCVGPLRPMLRRYGLHDDASPSRCWPGGPVLHNPAAAARWSRSACGVSHPCCMAVLHAYGRSAGPPCAAACPDAEYIEARAAKCLAVMMALLAEA